MDLIFNVIEKERKKQEETINLVSSSNYVSSSVLNTLGSILNNSIYDIYHSRKSHFLNDFLGEVENIAIEYAKKVFDVKYANVQPDSKTVANMAVFNTLLNKDDKVLSLNLELDKHSSFDYAFNSDQYNFTYFSVDKETNQIDYEMVRKIALKERPKLILVDGSYTRKLDFSEFKDIATSCGAYLLVDISNIAGLVAAGLHQNPCKYADVVTLTTNKTLRGPKGGLILTNKEWIIKKIDQSVLYSLQGKPLINVIAAKAICFKEAMKSEFVSYQKQTIKNAKILSDILRLEGFKIITNGTDNHLILLDVKKSVNMTGKEAEKILNDIGILCNKNMIPYDPTTPFITSGLLFSTSAMTTRGFKEKEFLEVGKIIATCLFNSENKEILEDLKKRVSNLCENFPIGEEVN